MLCEYEELRSEIRNTRINEKDYTKSIQICNGYLKLLSNVKNKNIKTDKWFAHHDIALNNKKLGNVEVAMKNAILAINNTTGDCDYRYFSSLWLMAECNSLIGNKEEAFRMYGECSRFYKYINDQNLRACVIWNKSKILNNTKIMLKIINIYEKQNLNSNVKTYGDMEYDSVLTEMYTDLFNIYAKTNIQAAFLLLYILRDKSLRKELGKQLAVA